MGASARAWWELVVRVRSPLGAGVIGEHAGEGLLLKRLLKGDQSASAHSASAGGSSPLTAPHRGDGGDGPDRRCCCCGEAAGDGPDDVGLDVGLDDGRMASPAPRWGPLRGGVVPLVRGVRARPPRAARRLASCRTAAVACTHRGGRGVGERRRRVRGGGWRSGGVWKGGGGGEGRSNREGGRRGGGEAGRCVR